MWLELGLPWEPSGASSAVAHLPVRILAECMTRAPPPLLAGIEGLLVAHRVVLAHLDLIAAFVESSLAGLRHLSLVLLGVGSLVYC